MSIVKLNWIDDNTSDIEITNGRAEMISGVEETKQAIKYEILHNLGDWYLGTNFGGRWLGENGLFDDKSSTKKDFEFEFIRICLNSEDVTGATVISNTIDRINRKISIKMNLSTVYGEDELEVEL